jgi:hypothetical protein
MMMSQYNNRSTTVGYCYYYYIVIILTNYLVVLVAAFHSSSSSSINHCGDYSTSRLPLMVLCHQSGTQLFAASTTTSKSQQQQIISAVDDDDLKLRILKLIEPTKRGLSTTPTQRIDIEKEIRLLESICPIKEPARDIRMGGLWEVLYTTAPPPSNGQLGPFIGTANQKIDLDNGTYSNILEIGGSSSSEVGEETNTSSKKPWLTAVLTASWEEWDGTLLEEKGDGGEKIWRDAVVDVNDVNVNDDDDNNDNNNNNNPFTSFINNIMNNNNKDGNANVIDYGATSWKVDFRTIIISLNLFDNNNTNIPLFKQQFSKGTSRVWRMSYLDNDTRIVRAGRTGKGEDDVVFYMIRK